jgi:hypothetical protein
MAKSRAYRVHLTRTTLSSATITVTARSRQEAIFLAAKAEPEWVASEGPPEIASVTAE